MCLVCTSYDFVWAPAPRHVPSHHIAMCFVFPVGFPSLQIPASSEHYTGEGALALPKLNLQFLTVHDYLLRNFHLFRWVTRMGYNHVAQRSAVQRMTSWCDSRIEWFREHRIQKLSLPMHFDGWTFVSGCCSES